MATRLTHHVPDNFVWFMFLTQHNVHEQGKESFACLGCTVTWGDGGDDNMMLMIWSSAQILYYWELFRFCVSAHNAS